MDTGSEACMAQGLWTRTVALSTLGLWGSECLSNLADRSNRLALRVAIAFAVRWDALCARWRRGRSIF